MHFMKIGILLVLGLAASSARAAGLTSIQVPASADGPALSASVWSPCATPPEEVKLGPMTVAAVRNCPISGSKLPLVIISHGHGGGSLNHHDVAETLADAGYLVVALNHPGDNFSDPGRSGDISIMFQRPRDIKRLIDFLLASWSQAEKIDADRIGFFGFSRGGYTGLVLAGAVPDFRDPTVPCPEPAPICGEIRRDEIPSEPLAHDPRIKALVLADPLSFFSTKESLKAVDVPIQLWSSEHGGDGVLPDNVAALVADLPRKPDFHVVPGSGHFAFLAPCPPGFTKSRPEICTDEAGFDRAAFHKTFDADVLEFLRQNLGSTEEN
ncbi:putative dienelactone hydrolase [Rhizobium sp. ERR 922]|uniref:alpha/beta hydrolase family protein n=1 Tax=unclassified Rhizobium TaxID=2613769 RepID=UPI0011A1D25A|nr:MULTISPECIES: alpha/beta fold hydrolase [unclassified Rhizobium]TWB47358.1 putative dienelactone hydrolase [Rhizobium sp. ERR 922]TWB91013.1 putative dienelactone hydrolase [Rhizobium sp. ERR 942]